VRIGWLSDIHLNFLHRRRFIAFLRRLGEADADAWVISGDIGEADTVVAYLREMRVGLGTPIYFVLGNHDYYGASLRAVHERVRTAQGEGLVWLTDAGVVWPQEGMALVGEGGWGDARLGDPWGSEVELNDFRFIEDLKGLGRTQLIRKLNRLGDACAQRLRPKLREAAVRATSVLLVTHVPPFADAAWYEGRRSEPE
jgi:Icc-related predicted phosphoesterase